MISDSSSMLGGFRFTTLKARILFSKFQRFMQRSSADKKFSPSGLVLRELML
jgi:hypothetical protein